MPAVCARRQPGSPPPSKVGGQKTPWGVLAEEVGVVDGQWGLGVLSEERLRDVIIDVGVAVRGEGSHRPLVRALAGQPHGSPRVELCPLPCTLAAELVRYGRHAASY